MGYYGKIDEKQLAQKLRRRGFSYGQILQQITVSKDTISRWCKDIPLSEPQKAALLKRKKFGQKKGSLIAAENKQRERIQKTKIIYSVCKKELGLLKSRDKFIAGVALYAAEGHKADRQGGFTNSDPRLISFMINWFLTYPKIPMSKLRGAIWIHEGLDMEKAKKYWANLTDIPANQFHKTYIVKNHKNKTRKIVNENGIISIRFTDSEKHRKIMGWISAMLDAKIQPIG
jgi:hypothetical protein